MAWNAATALARIKKLKGKAPSIDVQRLKDYMPIYEADQISLALRNKPQTPPLFSLPKGKAVVVDTVQIYIKITNYDEYRLENGRETEASHERAMRLLHLYYSAADRAFENSAAQRVDFHGGRVHAVVLEPGDQGITRETLSQALEFVEDFRHVADIANRELAQGIFNATFRVGLDIGTCVAINNGTGCEQEPMYLGSAANHAAKLAHGDAPGVYLSDRVRRLLDLQELGANSEFMGISDAEISLYKTQLKNELKLLLSEKDHRVSTENIVAQWRDEIERGDFTFPAFRFSHKEPPLSKIDYATLQPSRSIRMPLVSMYADLSGYTDYIDRAVAENAIQEAVRALYVIRQEFQNVVEIDFGGRKVRFIGDCIHAVIAEGSKTSTDARKSVAVAAQCAGGLHSSFNLCKSEFHSLDGLGLAIGLELGQTPISRIGIRGDRSVRIASSIATKCSERMQRECEDNGVKFGPEALSAGPAALDDLLDETGYSADVNYGEFAVCLSANPASLSNPIYPCVDVPNVTPQPRAHFKSE